MSKNRSYRKYAVTAMAAAAAVASVAPIVASAEEATEFPDVNDATVPAQEMKDAIYSLVEQGAIIGDNGKFHPNAPVLRGQIAQIFTEALDLPIPEDIEAVNKQYSDVGVFGGNADYVAAVTEAGLFHGSEGKFGVWSELSRQQMATVLKRYMTSNGIESEKDVSINLDSVSPSHRAGVQYLANLGLTTETDAFRPFEDVLRAQFATFFVRAQDVMEDNIQNPPTQSFITAASSVVVEGTTKIDIEEVEYTATVATDVVEDGDNIVKITFDDKGLDISNLNKVFEFDVDEVTYKAVKGNDGWTINILQNIEIEKLEPIEVYLGISADDVDLPKTVQATDTNGKVEDIEVTWDISSLDLNQPGEYTLTGKLSNVPAIASIKVIVQKEYPDSVKIEESNVTMKKEENVQLNAKVSPENTVKKDLTWSSSDNSVVSVDQNGKVTGVSEGTATITVSTENGNEDTISVTVDNRPTISTNAYGSININGVLMGINMQINNLDNTDVIVERVEVYEGDSLTTNYDKGDLESNGIETLVKPNESWGMSISYKLGIFEKGSYVKFHIKSKGSTYQFVEKLDD